MEIKKKLRFFDGIDYAKEQDYLQRRHREGWKLVKISKLGMYYFEKCEPEDVVYQLDFNKPGTFYKEEYIKMFSDCGWEYLQEYGGYAYFRKNAAAMNGDEEIFCDADTRLAMIKRIYKAFTHPHSVLAVVWITLSLIWLFSNDYVKAAIYAVIGIGYLLLVISYGIRYRRVKATLRK